MTGDAPTSWHLVRAAAEGRADTRDEFVRRYAAVVRAYLSARWRGSTLAAEVDDAAQDVFVDCFRRDGALGRASAARPARFRAFLYGVTRMTARRYERDRATRRRVVVDADSAALGAAPSPMESLSRVFDRAWAGSLLRRAARLQEETAGADESARRRVELLRLRFRDGRPIRDIAELWGVETAWLHHQYATARDEFRRALLDVVREEVGAERADRECARLVEHFF
jgi:RNA polymerase sigma-70 factor (ECF subfamily)